jgi:DNA-binding GntR family transcriptional regulator
VTSAGPSLSAFRRTSTTEDVAVALREAIIRGELAQGTPLREMALAERLNVGRGPIREAIRQLVQEGLVEYRVNRGSTVKWVTIDDVRDLYVAREAIESEATARVLAADPPPVFAGLEAALEELRRAAEESPARPSNELVERDIALHHELVQLAQSPRLNRMSTTLSAEIRMFLLQNHPDYPAERYIDDHERLVEALVTRRPDAVQVVRHHLRSALEVIVGSMSHDEDASGSKGEVGALRRSR